MATKQVLKEILHSVCEERDAYYKALWDLVGGGEFAAWIEGEDGPVMPLAASKAWVAAKSLMPPPLTEAEIESLRAEYTALQKFLTTEEVKKRLVPKAPEGT